MTILAVAAPSDTTRYSLRVATEGAHVEAAQRLRYQVFAEELGAQLNPGNSALDVDEFDEYCDHLVIVEDNSGEVVGTYRMLPPNRTPKLYADHEFNLVGLSPLRKELVETGRSCVHPDHRSGAVISLMWAGIARYMHLSGYRWLAGCASVGLADGGASAQKVWNLAQSKHLAPPSLRVPPRNPWPVGSVGPEGGQVPPLLRGYLRLSAYIGGPPAHDPDFGCADFFVLLSLDRADERYMRHFLGE